MKRIGFLSFGHWQPVPGRCCDTARDALVQTIELAVAAEELGRRRGVRARAPFRAPARVAVPAARRDGRPHEQDRDRHGCDRHALREPAVHGRGCRGSRPDQRRSPAARHQPRLARDGARTAPSRSATCPRDGETDADMARAHTELFRAAIAGAGVGESDPQMTGVERPLAIEPQLARALGADLVGRRHPRDRGVDRRAGHEPDELDPADRRHRRAVRPAAGRADRDFRDGVERGRRRARAARLGQPQRPADHRRRDPPLLRRAARAERRTRSATSTAVSPASAGATSASPT